MKAHFNVLLDFFDVATKLCSTYPSPMRFWFGTEMAVIVTDVQQAEVSTDNNN